MAEPQPAQFTPDGLRVLNPVTKRYITAGGPTHKSLISNGVLPPYGAEKAPKATTTRKPQTLPVDMKGAVDEKRHIRTGNGRIPVEAKHPRPALHLSDSGEEDDDEDEPAGPSAPAGPSSRRNIKEIHLEDMTEDDKDEKAAALAAAALDDPAFANYTEEELINMFRLIL